MPQGWRSGKPLDVGCGLLWVHWDLHAFRVSKAGSDAGQRGGGDPSAQLSAEDGEQEGQGPGYGFGKETWEEFEGAGRKGDAGAPRARAPRHLL